MKFITHFFRLIIGALFVFSGFVKLVDPLGTAYKMKDYFASDVLNMEFLNAYVLPIALFLILAEVILGIMLLVGYKPKFTVWSLFLMMLIFLFLTFYSYYYDVVKDCGCFGDFKFFGKKLGAWETFVKNLIFLPLILWLLIRVKDIRPFYSNKLSRFITILFFIGFSFIAYYVLQHLPLFDFRPYAIGKNIPEQMIYPEGAKEDVYDITFIYNVDGVDKKFSESEKPWEIKGATFVDRKTVLLEKGYEPPVHDFTMEKHGFDLTEQLMTYEKLMLIISRSIKNVDSSRFTKIKEVTDKALNNGYAVFLLTASSEDDFVSLRKEYALDFEMLFCDETTLKTMIRSNPGIMTFNKGTVVGKWSFNDAHKVKIKEGMGRKTIALDFTLKNSLDSIYFLDQKYRSIIDANNPKQRDSLLLIYNIPKDSLGTDFWAKQAKIDKTNMSFLDEVIHKYGYPGRSLVGELSKDGAASVIINSNAIATHIERIKEAANKDELTYTKSATMEDMYLMNKGEKQLYGTQTVYFNGEYVIWPIKDIEAINVRRKEAGFSNTLQEYAKELFGKSYFFEPVSLEDIQKQ